MKIEELTSVDGSFLHWKTNLNHTLSEKELVQIVALHWLGTGQYHSVGDMHSVSMASVRVPVLISDKRW